MQGYAGTTSELRQDPFVPESLPPPLFGAREPAKIAEAGGKAKFILGHLLSKCLAQQQV